VHIRYLQQKEAEQRFGVSDDWILQHMWLIGSFTRAHVHQYAARLACNGFLVATSTWLRASPAVLADLFFVVVFLTLLCDTMVLPYRVRSSNGVSITLSLSATLNGWFALMRAHGMKSAVVVDSNYSYAMIAINVATVVMLCVCCIYAARRPAEWPTSLALDTTRFCVSALVRVLKGC
jgi:hypothetical protein